MEGLEMEKDGLENEGVLIPPELVKQLQIVVKADGHEYREALASILMSTWMEGRRPGRTKRSMVPVKEEEAEENPANGNEVLGDELTNFAQGETEECSKEEADDVGERDEEKMDLERVEDEPVHDNGVPGNSVGGGLEKSNEEAADDDELSNNRVAPGSKEKNRVSEPEESSEEAADDDGLSDNRIAPGLKEKNNKLLECSICEKSFTRNSSFWKHKKTAHANLGKKYPCTICKKELRIYGLKDHMKAVHSSKSYHCPQCDYVAPWAARIKTHVQSVHEGIKYPCSHCDYQATKDSN